MLQREITTTRRFIKANLPRPRPFYEGEFGTLRRERRGWCQVRCPFHKGNSPTSLALNLENGGFYCFSCGAKGGDILAYVMLRDGVDFKTAAQLLGAWENWAKPQRSCKVVVGRDLVCDFIIDGTQYSARVKDDPRHWLDQLRRVYRAASDRLSELIAGEKERFEGEAENCWSIMADTLPQIRQAEVL